MSDPTPTPPAAPPPKCINWLRACVVGSIGLYIIIGLFAPPPGGFIVSTGLALLATPVLLIWWTWSGFRRQSSSEGASRFRRLWTWIWLGAALTSVVLFSTSTGWHIDAATTGLRLAVVALLFWTTLLVVIAWGAHRALGKKAFWKRIAFTAVVLATLIALFYAEENWRGRRQWEQFRAEWKAKGVKFSIAEVMPPPVPDDQNMAMHPLFKPMFNYRLNFESGLTWLDTNGMARLDKLTPHPREVSVKGNKVRLPYEAWPFGTGTQDRTNGVKLANISRWPEYYRLDTNFAAMPAAPTPALEVLRYLDRHEPTLALLDEVLTRPQSQFPWKTEGQMPSAVLLPHLGKMKGITALLCVRATARIEAGQSDAALRDVERAWRLCGSLEHEPFLISQLVQISIQAMTVGCIAHGTAAHRWEERHLLRLDELLRPASKLKNLQFAIRGEAALMAQQLTMMERDRTIAANEVAKMAQMVGAEGERMTQVVGTEDERVVKIIAAFSRFVAQHAPAGWYFQSLARQETALLGHLSASFADVEQRRLFWQNPPAVPAKLWFDRFWPFKNVEGSFIKTAAKCARLQTNFDHARLACALERHWLRHRVYPEKLDALVPEFLDRIPHDLFDGQPMRYRREGEQGFVLWSIGFDGKDDNAGPLHFAGNQGGSVGEEMGDLVWRYPQTK